MHPNVSERVTTGPEMPEKVEKLCENVEKLRGNLFLFQFNFLISVEKTKQVLHVGLEARPYEKS